MVLRNQREGGGEEGAKVRPKDVPPVTYILQIGPVSPVFQYLTI